MKARIIVTVVTILCAVILSEVIGVGGSAAVAGSAAAQVEADGLEVAARRSVANRNWGAIPYYAAFAVSFCLWIGPLMTLIKRLDAKGKASAAAILLVYVGIGCGPPKIEMSEEVQPHETAFVVPMESAKTEDQAQLKSEDFLNRNLVTARRIILDQRKKPTGRFWWNYEWVPLQRVIKVSRKPVTREWTKDPETGSQKLNKAIGVESLDSIGFSVGAVCTARVPEASAARFQAKYGGTTLEQVMDEVIRGKVAGILSREFSKSTLSEGRGRKEQIATLTFDELQRHFGQDGIEITNFGLIEGLWYDDKEIQEAINRVFAAERLVEAEGQENKAQEIRNEREIAKAIAEASAALEFARAEEARTAQIRLEIENIRAQAFLKAAERWNGNAPAGILPEGSGFLFGLGDMSNE